MEGRFILCAFLVFSLLHLALSLDPSPSPEPAADSPSISDPSPSPDSGSPSEPPILPFPSDVVSPGFSSPAPAPALTEPSDMNHSDNVEAGDGTESSESGSSGGKKAGIVIGVVAAACLVGLGGFVYKKRQHNIRRAQYASAARTDQLL